MLDATPTPPLPSTPNHRCHATIYFRYLRDASLTAIRRQTADPSRPFLSSKAPFLSWTTASGTLMWQSVWRSVIACHWQVATCHELLQCFAIVMRYPDLTPQSFLWTRTGTRCACCSADRRGCSVDTMRMHFRAHRLGSFSDCTVERLCSVEGYAPLVRHQLPNCMPFVC